MTLFNPTIFITQRNEKVDSYLIVKFMHIIAAVVVAGTGSGIAFFMLMAYRSGSHQAIKITASHVVLADWIFTLPAVVIQLVSGLWLMTIVGYSFQSIWFISVIALFIFIGICWIPVLAIQYQLRALAQQPTLDLSPRSDFARLMRRWVFLGITAFTALIAIFILMVFKPLPLV